MSSRRKLTSFWKQEKVYSGTDKFQRPYILWLEKPSLVRYLDLLLLHTFVFMAFNICIMARLTDL